LLAFFNDVDRWHPLPGGVTFGWSERDLKDQQAKAGIAQTRAATRKTQVESGEITPEQALQMAVDAGDVPESFIAVDAATEETLTDEDKATEGIDQPNPDAAEPVATTPTPEAAPLPKVNAPAVALKAATTLARIIPSPADEPSGAKAAASYWREVTKAFDEIGRIWTIAAREQVPQAEGETARSIKFQISGRGGPAATLKLMAGNNERPEVAIRATLFGRKGFGPKRAKGVLRFKIGNQVIFARKVRGAAANDWQSRAMKQIEPQMRDVESKLASLTVNQIEVSDIAGAKFYKTAPPAPGGSKRKRRKK